MYSQKLPSGKYRFFESYIDPMTMTRKTTSVTMDRDTRQSRKTAQEALRVKIIMLGDNSADKKGLSLRELLAAYEESMKGIIRPQTMIRNVHTLNRIVDMLGPETQADKLTARYVTTKFTEWDAKPVTKNERMVRLKTFMRWANRMDYVKNVSWLDKLPRYEDSRKARREYKYLENDELERLIDAMVVTHHRQITQLAALTGMRIGEILALKTKNVDLDERVIHVVETVSATTKQDGPTKTDGSTRDIYIQNELVPLIKDIEPGKVYFFEENGKRVEYYTYNKYLREVSERVLGRQITTHYMRHTHTSLLASKGVDLPTISRRLGHSDSRVTEEIYLHVTKEMVNRDRALLDAVSLLKPTRDLRGHEKTPEICVFPRSVDAEDGHF